MNDDSPERQRPLAERFGAELWKLGTRYREDGLADTTRTGVLLGAALALLDLQFQEQVGRTLNEEEFLGLARLTYREIREKNGPVS